MQIKQTFKQKNKKIEYQQLTYIFGSQYDVEVRLFVDEQ